ncbi:MAG: hypothetical protein GY790_23870 [Bacteroidetes bacterium]|nr:hypothetical protein [Bacteroidota bacterium]
MKLSKLTIVWAFIILLVSACGNNQEHAISINEAGDEALSASEFLNPPDRYKTWVFWWWLKGWIDEEGIRADLDHMKNMGISGALVFNAGPSNNQTPFTTEFMSPRWRQLFRYAVEQADLRSIEIGLNMCDGWNAGGPWITPEYAMSTGHKIKASGGSTGFELDSYNPAAMDLQWESIMGKIIDEAGEEWRNKYVGKTFKYTHIDSWEGGDPMSSPVLAEEFKARRGYELGSKSGIRYTEDFDLTRAELWADNYYGRLSEKSHALNMQTHSEAGGPSRPLYHYMGDMLRNYGSQDIVMGEFWSREDGVNMKFHNEARTCNLEIEDLIKSASSAAHIYGKEIVQAEAFTKIQKNFTRSFWDLKDVGDRAFCQGLNRNVLCFMVAQAGGGVKPGYTWRDVGMEFPRTMTYWPMGKAWIDYLNRCHYLLQQGTFEADFLYFHGIRGPVAMPAKFHMNPAKPDGYDCDMVNAHALLTRVSAKDKRVSFPDGQSYSYLVLRADNTDALTPVVLSKLLELVSSGVTLIGHPPERNYGYEGYPASDEDFERLNTDIWGQNPGASGSRSVGSGRVIWGPGLEAIVKEDKLAPDLEIVEDKSTAALPDSVMSGLINPGFDYVHRKIGDMDVYFLANLRNASAAGDFTFRSKGQPQVWCPVDGSIREISEYTTVGDKRTKISLDFEARQSLFVVFGSSEGADEPYLNNAFVFDHGISGPWNVAFDSAWGGPADVEFNTLMDWTDHSNDGIKYYSGTASYTKTFDLPSELRSGKTPVYLDLGIVKDIAEVSLNGTDLGVVWCEPFRLEITGAVKNRGNVLKIKVVNKWSNRLQGDEVLKENYTTGNASHHTTLYSSGLLGPVKLGYNN